MASIIQFRRDYITEWERVNPILADAEIGFILDKEEDKIIVDDEGKESVEPGLPKSSLYKVGDGYHRWSELPLFGFSGTFDDDLNTAHDSDPNTAVSKAALMGKFASIQSTLDTLTSSTGTIELDVEDLKAWSLEVKDVLPGIEDSIQSHSNDLGELKGKVEGLETGVETLNDEVSSMGNRLSVLEGMHVILTQAEFERMSNEGLLKEDVLYFTYEEETE